MVYWALSQAIELNTGGINGPPQIATISKPNSKYATKILSEDDMNEHAGLVGGVEECIREFRAKLCGKKIESASPIPEPPKGK
jgi:hypothetical protein